MKWVFFQLYIDIAQMIYLCPSQMLEYDLDNRRNMKITLRQITNLKRIFFTVIVIVLFVPFGMPKGC